MKPWLWLPATWSHKLAPYGLKISSLFQDEQIPTWQSFVWKGLSFPNRLGLAGGADKNAESLDDWWAHGVGFIEIGTITPLPQKQNPGSVIGRDPETHSVWNKLGFPSYGAYEVLANIESYENLQSPLFINIGKNRSTPVHQAHEDYIFLMKTFAEVADVFVVNISSPNTKDLRLLQKKENLEQFLAPILELNKTQIKKPLLIKLSPDEEEKNFKEMISTCSNLGVDGFVLTNTTSSRDFKNTYSTEGGVSGRPLANKSLLCLKWAVAQLGAKKKDFLIVSTGGVFDAQSVRERLQSGADLVQVYSELIFEGPQLFKRIALKMNTEALS